MSAIQPHQDFLFPARRWWLGLMLILVLAGGLRFTGINFGLPYFENSDEPWFFYEAAFQRGLIGTWLHPNPSQGLIGLYKGLQIGVEALTGQTSLNYVSEITLALRNINAVASLVTLIVVALCARELGGDIAGLLAAGLWAVIPTVAFFSGNAIAESWMMLFAAIAAYFAVLALHRRVMAYALVSVWAGLFAFAFKYSMFSFAGLGVAATLWSYWANRGDRLLRGRWLRSLILQILSIGLFLGAIVALGGFINDINNPSREMEKVLRNPLEQVTNPVVLGKVITTAFTQIGLTPWLFIALFAFGTWRIASGRPLRENWSLVAWIGLSLQGTFVMFLVPLYLLYDGTIPRYLFSADLIFVMLSACSFVLLCQWIIDHLTGLMAKDAQRSGLRAAGIVVAVGIVVLWLTPLAAQAAADSIERTRPNTLTDMTVWASSTLGEGGVLAEFVGHRAFNREFGGYSGPYRKWIYEVDPLTKPPATWQQDGYQYVQMLTDVEQKLEQTPAGRDWLAQLQLMRRFPPPNSTLPWRGDQFTVFRIGRIEQAAEIEFDKTITLVGVDGLQPQVTAGSRLTLRMYWQAPQRPADNYSLFVHITPVGKRSELIAQADGAPGPARRPTLSWDLPSEVIISEPFTLTLPPTLPVGEYAIWVGLYNPYSGQRLTTSTGDDWQLTTVTVK